MLTTTDFEKREKKMKLISKITYELEKLMINPLEEKNKILFLKERLNKIIDNSTLTNSDINNAKIEGKALYYNELEENKIKKIKLDK